jgi:DNA polymerase-3 subunit epsilon
MKIFLEDLHILALDCQTTGANPDKGHLLEIGWVKARASTLEQPEDLQPQAYLAKLPAADEIPRTVARITGIGADDLKAATDQKMIWQELVRVSQDVAAGNPNKTCPAVIHFARFEEPFLRDLHQKYQSAGTFPYQVICTHEIARRLLPDLPRRGLRAIAGFFGHAMPEYRRSADHALATVIIWKNLIALLKSEANISTLDQLLKWMASSAPAVRSRRSYPMDPELRRSLPDQPGVYRMLRANGNALYIGKAKSLKKRVSSYFRQSGSPGEHILEMLTQAYHLDFTETGSALEAAILETDEIKRQSPPYNVALRARQRHLVFCSRDLQHFARETNEDHPIGPLPSGNLNSALKAFAILINTKAATNPAGFEEIADTLLGISSEYVPERDCLREGVEIFRQRHQGVLQQGDPIRILTGLGARLWREHLERLELEANTEADVDATEAPKTEDDRQVWTPDDVAHLIESVMRRAAHLIRRSRWFCMLSEASLAWASAAAEDHDKILLSLKKGVVVQRGKLGVGEKTPVPVGYTTPTDLRRQSIDLMTYDRLRVLTTELRRLVAEGRDVELRLRPTAKLGNPELEKVLRWV